MALKEQEILNGNKLNQLIIMNTNIKYLIFACTILGISCTREETAANFSERSEITITAIREGFDPLTKTIRNSDGSVDWCPMDEISVFYKDGENGGSKFTSQNTEQTAIAEFKGILEGIIAGGEEFINGKYIYGVYPYSTNTSFSNGITTISLPSNQIATEGTFSNRLFPTIARAHGLNLAFYNICGGVKFSVSREDISSISIKGNNNERLAGTAKVMFDEETGLPTVLDDEIESKNEITVYAPNGGTFEVGKEYYIVAYPTLFRSGYTMTFRTSELKQGVYISNSEVEIQRSNFSFVNQIDKEISSWTDITSDGGGTNSGIYLGIMGFNQQLYPYSISELTDENKVGFDTFIDNLNMENGTLLYYAVDQAINTMQSVTLPSDLSTAAIVTFTDGLDQGSMMMNVPYSDETEYLDALNKRIMNETVNSSQPITAYSIGIRGQDVTDVTMFKNNLAKLASSVENATEVTSMSEVNARFKEIAEQLSRSNYVQTINLSMPGVSNGTLVRFTFDNVNNAELSSLYIEGTFNLSNRSLENVKYVGMTSTSGTEINGTVDGIFVTFTFEGVRTDNNKLIDSKFTDEWTYITSNDTWQKNSEFDKTENSDIVTERNSAVIILVLDCSSSLASDFVKAQTNAKDFINTLYLAAGGNGELNPNPDDDDNVLYSTIPKDLSLAIWKEGKRYYLSREDYAKANLTNSIIEGLTIVSGGESFIFSLKNIQTNSISEITTAKRLYETILPNETQGKIISAKFSDINNALKNFNGITLNNYYYTTSTSTSNDYDFTNCIGVSGGVLTETNSSPYIRGVKSTSDTSAILWTDPNDLKLSVVINGTREFLDTQEYNERIDEIDTIEGVAIFAGDEKFIIHLQNAQTDAISSIATAMELYSDILPTADQGIIISAKLSDINTALSSFNGKTLSSQNYTSATVSSNSYAYNYCIITPGGRLYSTNSKPYIRGVTNIE